MRDFEEMAKIPKILKIYKKDFPVLGCLFSTGEARLINLRDFFERIGILEGDFGFTVAQDKEVFDTVELEDYTLTWNNVRKTIQLPKGEPIEVNFQLDTDVLYKNSAIDPEVRGLFEIGPQLKKIRKSLGLTQEEVAKRIGTNKNSLSRIESGATDPEFNTLRKIFEVGFEKKFAILPYDEENPFSIYNQSLINKPFESWLQSNWFRIDLIAGVDDKVQGLLHELHLDTIKKIANAPYNSFYEFMHSRNWHIDNSNKPETWSIQAKFLEAKDWLALIIMQRRIETSDKNSGESKVERLAKEEIGDEIFKI